MNALAVVRTIALGGLVSLALSQEVIADVGTTTTPDLLQDSAFSMGKNEARSPEAKAYGVGAALDIVGSVTYVISNVNRTARATVDKIRNNSSTMSSGTLRLRLFVTTTPLSGPFTFWTIGQASLDPLPPNYAYNDLDGTVPLFAPPDGIYYIHLGIFEYEGTCGSSDGYCLDDYVTFDGLAQVTGGIFSPYTAAPSTAVSVEYFHTTFGHYFTTGSIEEIAALDAGTFQGWVRTGQTFKVWTGPGAGKAGVCRFFTTAFAPRSSHFYTPFANECAFVKGNAVWQYEAVVAYVELPNAAGSCSGGAPLYRLYNNGRSGAPNHRYTTSTAVRSQMIAQGWTPEGSGTAGVIACVPL